MTALAVVPKQSQETSRIREVPGGTLSEDLFGGGRSRAHGILESAFEGSGGEEGEGLLSSQHLLTHPDSLSAILGMLPDEGRTDWAKGMGEGKGWGGGHAKTTVYFHGKWSLEEPKSVQREVDRCPRVVGVEVAQQEPPTGRQGEVAGAEEGCGSFLEGAQPHRVQAQLFLDSCPPLRRPPRTTPSSVGSRR